MIKKENFHTHSIYCDGKDTPEEMVLSAIEKGFTDLGFSGHAYIDDFECDWAMTAENSRKYISEINDLKIKYRDKINIYCGTELDYFCTDVPGKYDFTIGSVHYLNMGGEYQAIDYSLNEQQKAADKYFGGSLIDYAVEYYRITGDVLNKLNADIIGHFDLVTKFNEGQCAFDTGDKRYVNAWHDAVDALIPYNKPFEINTGAISRGYRKSPYPSLDIAEYIHSKGGYFILTSDCHDKNKLDCYFAEAEKEYSKFEIIKFSEILNK